MTINFYRADNIRIVDLPGYGYAKVPFAERTRWSDLMESYFKTDRNIKHVFSLVDMRHPVTDFDMSMLDFLYQMGIKYSVVLTKCDKLNKSEYASRLELVKEELGKYGENVEIIPFSSHTGQGVETLREIIDRSL